MSAKPFLPREHRAVLLQPVRRWTTGRKERLLAAIVDGLVSEAEACRAHTLSRAELDEWARGQIASRTHERMGATRHVPFAERVRRPS